MFRLSSTAVRATLFLLAIAGIMALPSYAQDYCNTGGWPGLSTPLKQKKVPNVTIPGTNHIKGYLEKLPDDYDANPTKKYPLLVFIHGINEYGTGTSAELCKLISQWWWCPPTLVEYTNALKFPDAVTDQNGTTHKFILISPQLLDWGVGADPNAVMNPLLDYLIANYRVDPSRVYLTGMSAGANFIQSYAGYSEANARRVAAIAPVSVCGYLTATEAQNIAKANLPTWFFQCINDNGPCAPGDKAQLNAALINSQSPAPAIAANQTTFPVPEQACNATNPHDVWGYVYNKAFKQTVNGRNVSSYEWLVQYSRAALLPVVLEDYTVSLRDGKVKVRWTTSAESNNARFNIERSGDGKKFTEIATIPASGHSTGKTYEWVDDRPLPNLNYYRLTQTDLDGRKEHFAIKKIINRSLSDRTIIVAPNPFTSDLTAYINVPHTQQVTVSVTDMSGRVLKTVQGKYAEGAAEISMNTTDLPKGLYLLKVKGEDFAQTQKIVKQ